MLYWLFDVVKPVGHLSHHQAAFRNHSGGFPRNQLAFAEVPEALQGICNADGPDGSPECHLITGENRLAEIRFQRFDDVYRLNVRTADEIGVGTIGTLFVRNIRPKCGRRSAGFVTDKSRTATAYNLHSGRLQEPLLFLVSRCVILGNKNQASRTNSLQRHHKAVRSGEPGTTRRPLDRFHHCCFAAESS